MHPDHNQPAPPFWKSTAGICLIVVAAVAGYFLLTEHRAHVIGWLPYILLALCPLMHIFMHGGHGHGGHDHSGHDGGHAPAQRPPAAATDKEPLP